MIPSLRSIVFIVVFNSGQVLYAQVTEPEIRLALQLDSIARTSTLSRHFAALYTETALISLAFYQSAGSNDKAFIRRFEQAFAGHFLRADSSKGLGKGSEAWRNYYSDSSRSTFQYQLLGINAHINADISTALIGTFSFEELRTNRKVFLRFQQGLRKYYNQFYTENINRNGFTRLIGSLPFGLARTWGSGMMARWRKRQYRIALLQYSDPEKAIILKQKTARSKERIDRLIMRHL